MPPPSPISLLTAAIKNADATRVSELIASYPELAAHLNSPLSDGCFGATPLLAAVSRGDRATIDVLLKAGAAINVRSDWWAGSFGVLDTCATDLAPFLIERGAFVDAHAAARLGLFRRLKELVSAEPAQVHARGGDGQTPLHFASTVEIAGYLLDWDADIDARDIDHESTPVQYMLRDRPHIARALVARGAWTDILIAAALGDLDLVRLHLDRDPGAIRTRVSDAWYPKRNPHAGGTILIWVLGANRAAHHVAREFLHEDVFRLLMERSPVELQLTVACELGDESAVQRLLASHPNLADSFAEEDRRSLPAAAENNNTAALRLMLSAGWPVDARARHNATALHWAAWHGNAEAVRLLLGRGAPTEVRGDDWDLTPLGWSLHGSENSWHRATGDHCAVVEALLAAGAALPRPVAELEGAEPVLNLLRSRAAAK